jgi:hypothetical protein
LITQPQLLATAASDTAQISSAISAAKTAAASRTTGLVAAAEDEVSALTTTLFNTYAQEYHALLGQATAFHDEFAQLLATAGNTYAGAEAASASAISGFLGGLTALTGGRSPIPAASLQGTTFGLIMGGSGLPIPSSEPGYISGVLNYVNQNFNVLLANAPGLATPEGYYPLILKSLPLTPSISQGLSILDTAIKTQLAATPMDSVAVLGYSQSADISSLEMLNLANPALNPHPPTALQLGFTLLGDQMNPNGGMFARFPGFGGQPLTLPALGLTLYGATPSNTIYPTHIYTLEYDGWADFPQYPINFISDLNAVAGIVFVHGTYPSLNLSALPPGYAVQNLPTSPGYTGVTTYSMITTPNGLPLLEPLRWIPGIGNPLADLLQPDLSVIVNLGYGNPAYGWSTGPADVQTYFGLFPNVSPQLVAHDLIVGANLGGTAFAGDMHTEASTAMSNVSQSLASLTPAGGGGVSLSSFSHSLQSITQTGGGGSPLSTLASAVTGSVSPDSIITDIQTSVTNFANGISNTTANLYGALLPTADIANTLVTVLPAYDVNLVLSGIQQAFDGNVVGGLEYALVAPFAADTGLLTLAGGIELEVLLNGLGVSL